MADILYDIFWIFVGWTVGSFLLRLLMSTAEHEQRMPIIITPDNIPPDAIVVMTVHMEQIGEWWYGWFQNEDGTETFVSQGRSYDDALNNCKQRVQERNPGLRVKYIFEMKNASTAVQN
jgi:hypothetical protein